MTTVFTAEGGGCIELDCGAKPVFAIQHTDPVCRFNEFGCVAYCREHARYHMKATAVLCSPDCREVSPLELAE